ncbi:MAG: hypothetical protein IKC01_08695 [Clostridia bacterium]|nr:hypothetical protein [Clostridia bacterium]
MDLLKKDNLNALQKIFSVIAGGFLVGFMWRVRGNHGFGAKWGMFCVAFVIMLFIYALYGKREKMNYEMMPLCAVFAALTTGGWGTLNSQMSGYLSSSANFVGEDSFRYIEISEFSGLIIMLLLGFGWLPLFAISLGALFSKRKYEFKDFFIIVFVYYITVLLSNLTISHYILSVINPEAVEMCAEGIKDAGYEFSPMKAYIVKFGSAAWAKKIPFCRNYFTSINVISSAIGALTSVASTGIVLKDRFNAVFSFLVNTSCAIAITLADFVLILDSDRGVLKGIKTPGFLSQSAWATWEYFTGFIFGFLLLLVIALLPGKYTRSEENYIYTPLIKNKKFSLVYNGILTIFFSFVVILSRAFSFRLNEMTLDNDVFEIVLTVLISSILFFPVFKLIKKNIIDKGMNRPLEMLPWKFAAKILPVYIFVIALVYFFLGSPDDLNLISINYNEIFTAKGFVENWSEGYIFETLIMLVSFIAFNCFYKICVGKKIK